MFITVGKRCVNTVQNAWIPVRSAQLPGCRDSSASDYPPGPFEPMMALQSAVTRTDSKGNVWGPRQRITIEEAIRVGTLHGAYASYEENIKGSIERESWPTWSSWVATRYEKTLIL